MNGVFLVSANEAAACVSPGPSTQKLGGFRQKDEGERRKEREKNGRRFNCPQSDTHSSNSNSKIP